MRSSPPVHTTHPAFALYGLVWIVGSILGNAIGGYLSHPVERYPGIFARGGSLEEHPYLLPCLVTTGITLAGLLFTALFMEEVSRKRYKGHN
jgi:MFS family permease